MIHDPLENLRKQNRQTIKLGLDRIKACLDYLGNPQNRFKSVLIGGTNGKGTTTFYLSNLACKLTDYKIARYTSPHLVLWDERFVINKRIIEHESLNLFSQETINEILEFEKKNLQYGQLTEFEIYTIIAFKLFASEKVDLAFLEVGMGGRLDATNTTLPENTLLSVITNISLDHTEHLGNTIEKIAYEKAGIIKENNLIVTSADKPALTVIKNKANELNSKLYHVKFEEDKSCFDNNINLARKTWEVISSHIKTNSERIDIEDFLKGLSFPGRFQFFKEHNLILDGAHNPRAAGELKKLLNNHFPNKIIVYILGILNKDYERFIKNLIPENSSVICTEPKSTRATKKETLYEYVLRTHSKPILANNLLNAIEKAKTLEHDVIVITGSLYLVGEALELINNKQIPETVLEYN